MTVLDDSQTFDLIGKYAVIKGRSYNTDLNVSFTIQYPHAVDLSSWTPKAVIRTDYLSNGGLELASFDFSPLIYTGGILFIKPYLPFAKTNVLKPTDYQGESNKFKISYCYTWDLVLVSPTGIEKLPIILSSFVQVKYEVTE